VIEKPFFVILTNRCNMACPHCYNELDSMKMNKIKSQDPLNRERLQYLFKSLSEQGYEKCFFSGGEALLRKDAPEILGDAKRHGLKTALFTNGHVFSKEIVARLADVELDEVRISLNELAWIKSREQYERVLARQMQWVPELKKAGIGVGIIYILSKRNIRFLCETYDRLRRTGVGMKLQPLYLPEKARHYDSASSTKINIEEWEGIERYLEAYVESTDFDLEDRFEVYNNPWKSLRYLRFIKEVYVLGATPEFCPTGPMLVLDSEGYFHPCLFRFDLVCGHVSDDAVVDRISQIVDDHRALKLAPCFREECLSAYR